MVKVCVPHKRGVGLIRDALGDLPEGVEILVWEDAAEPPADLESVRVLVPPFLSGGPAGLPMHRLRSLRVVQLLTAGADAWIGRLPEGVLLCDGQGIHSSATAEWAAAVILASVRQLPRFVAAQRERRWDHPLTGELAGRRVLVVGAGDIGEALCRRLAPFGVELVRVARRARPDVHSAAELPDLLPFADVVVLLVPLTAATRGLVDADFLARMHDGALLVNAARGQVVDTDALLAELTSGRLTAALDVTDPEPLPPEHPLWSAPGLLLTPHVAASVTGTLPRAYQLVAAQLDRYLRGRPLENVVTGDY